MSIKMSELKTLSMCEKKYQLDKIGITPEKDKHYYMAIAAKEVLKEFLLLDKRFRVSTDNSAYENWMN